MFFSHSTEGATVSFSTLNRGLKDARIVPVRGIKQTGQTAFVDLRLTLSDHEADANFTQPSPESPQVMAELRDLKADIHELSRRLDDTLRGRRREVEFNVVGELFWSPTHWKS